MIFDQSFTARSPETNGTVWTRAPPGGVLTFWLGVCRTVLKTLTLFQTKIYYFSYPFSDLTPKIYTPFQTKKAMKNVRGCGVQIRLFLTTLQTGCYCQLAILTLASDKDQSITKQDV